MSKEPVLAIIIVSYNTKDLTIQTINSIIKDLSSSSKTLASQTELWIIDNNSQDESLKAIRKLLYSNKSLQTTIIANKTNKGFGAANNQAISQTKAKYCLLLNSDTIVQPGALIELVRTFERQEDNLTTAVVSSKKTQIDRLGIVAAQLLNPDKTTQPQGGDLPSLLSLTSQWLFLDDFPVLGKLLPSMQHTGKNIAHHRQATLYKTGWVGGTALCIKHEVISEIGLLDENIFMYGEDVEWCLRAKYHHWDTVIQPLAQVVHYGSASSSSFNALKGEVEALMYIWKKHFPSWQIPITRTVIKLGLFLRFLIFKLTNQPQKASQYQKISQFL